MVGFLNGQILVLALSRAERGRIKENELVQTLPLQMEEMIAKEITRK